MPAVNLWQVFCEISVIISLCRAYCTALLQIKLLSNAGVYYLIYDFFKSNFPLTVHSWQCSADVVRLNLFFFPQLLSVNWKQKVCMQITVRENLIKWICHFTFSISLTRTTYVLMNILCFFVNQHLTCITNLCWLSGSDIQFYTKSAFTQFTHPRISRFCVGVCYEKMLYISKFMCMQSLHTADELGIIY